MNETGTVGTVLPYFQKEKKYYSTLNLYKCMYIYKSIKSSSLSASAKQREIERDRERNKKVNSVIHKS